MKTITAKCSVCGYVEKYKLSRQDASILKEYLLYGRSLGKIQDLFPNIPPWIRSGAIDKYNNHFCICPKCYVK